MAHDFAVRLGFCQRFGCWTVNQKGTWIRSGVVVLQAEERVLQSQMHVTEGEAMDACKGNKTGNKVQQSLQHQMRDGKRLHS